MQFGRILIVMAIVVLCATAQAETVDVKYRGLVDLKPFTCTNTVSSFVNRGLLRQGQPVHDYLAEQHLVCLVTKIIHWNIDMVNT